MRTVVASLAAALVASALAGCGGGGAEPGASHEATVVLDFTPNAVHAGLYAALANGDYERRGIDLEIREPSATTDGPKLLEAGRAEFAILDIHDLAIARERGLDVVGIGAIVQRPLAAVIAADRERIRTPADLTGGTVGVTGLPSDDAVLDSVLEADGVDAGEVETVTIGFDSVAALSGGRLDAATGFWNAEGVALRRLGVETREFRVDSFGAPSYPELVIVASAQTIAERPELAAGMVAATDAGYSAVLDDPDRALEQLLEAVPALDANGQDAQLQALLDAEAIAPDAGLRAPALRQWAAWDAAHGIVDRAPEIESAFVLDLAAR